MMNIKGVLLQWFIIFLDKKRLLEQLKILNKYESYMNTLKSQLKNCIDQLLESLTKEKKTLNKELAVELHKPVIRNFKKKKNSLNKELAEKLHKAITRNFKKRKVHSSFIYNIVGAHLADIRLISKFCKGFTQIFIMCY